MSQAEWAASTRGLPWYEGARGHSVWYWARWGEWVLARPDGRGLYCLADGAGRGHPPLRSWGDARGSWEAP